jgi:hypothetical protein
MFTNSCASKSRTQPSKVGIIIIWERILSIDTKEKEKGKGKEKENEKEKEKKQKVKKKQKKAKTKKKKKKNRSCHLRVSNRFDSDTLAFCSFH